MRRILTTALCGALMAPAAPLATAWAQAPAAPAPTAVPVLDIPLQRPESPAAAAPVLGDPAPAPTEVAPAEVKGGKTKKKKLITKEKAGGTVGGVIGGLAGAAGGPLGKIAGSFVGRKIGEAVVGDDKDKKADEEAEVLQAQAETPPPAVAPEATGATQVAFSAETPAATADVVATEAVAESPPPVLAVPAEDPAANPDTELAYETPPY